MLLARSRGMKVSIDRRSILGGLAAAPALASSVVEDALAGVGGIVPTNEYGFPSTMVDKNIVITPAQRAAEALLCKLERKMHRGSVAIDPDIFGLRSVSAASKVRMQDERNEARMTAMEKLRRFIYGPND